MQRVLKRSYQLKPCILIGTDRAGVIRGRTHHQHWGPGLGEKVLDDQAQRLTAEAPSDVTGLPNGNVDIDGIPGNVLQAGRFKFVAGRNLPSHISNRCRANQDQCIAPTLGGGEHFLKDQFRIAPPIGYVRGLHPLLKERGVLIRIKRLQ